VDTFVSRGESAAFKRISSPVDLVALVAAGSLAALAVRKLSRAEQLRRPAGVTPSSHD
jgi:hypothetical protein